MKRTIFTIACSLCALAIYFYSLSAKTTTDTFSSALRASDIEALTQDEGGISIVCRCAGFLGNSQCKASNRKAICASGYNIQCQEWNGNC
ncbi:hypothetical protein [Alistipes dispar]|uniref:hypothetical protein n=1 Tax=Alistipes dispar TaxID=2585119 RepID=UPI001143DE6B|nr:hypothetical protein [Alistipes dispar]